MQNVNKTSIRFLLQEQGYNGAVRLGSRAFQYVTNLVMQTAIKVSCYPLMNLSHIMPSKLKFFPMEDKVELH